MNNSDFIVGEKVIVIEHTYTNEVFEWDGIVVDVTEAFVETKHCRNAVTHPQWHSYMKAYSDTYTKHYELDNIKKK
jgi:predicted GNAT family acetyltransferase